MSTIYNNKSTNSYTSGSDSSDDFPDIWGSSKKSVETTNISYITRFYCEGVAPVDSQDERNKPYILLHPDSNSDLENAEGHGSDSINSPPNSESDGERNRVGVEVNNSDPEVLEPTSRFSQFLSTLRKILVSFLIWSDKMNPFVNSRNAI